MKQCWFRQGDEKLQGWIEEKGAILGALVELKGEEGLWEVIKVAELSIDEKWLAEKRGRDRHGLRSIVRGK